MTRRTVFEKPKRSFWPPWTRYLVWLIAALLLWWALREVPFNSILSTLARLQGYQILIILLLNAGVIFLLSGRWWAILRAQGHRLPYIALSGIRLAAFAISYFTPGPQFGGEPLLIFQVRRRYGVKGTQATATVALDKAIELLGNFSFLVFGVYVLLLLQFIEISSGLWLIGIAIGLLALPILYLYAASKGGRPLSFLLKRVPWRLRVRIPPFKRWMTVVEESETYVSEFYRSRPKGLTQALIFTLVSWAALILEYWLMARFLGLYFNFWETIAILTSARLAFLTPLPGGLGALEASQMLAASALGFSPAEGLSLGLLIRGRDLAFGGLGLILAARYTRSEPPVPSSSVEPPDSEPS